MTQALRDIIYILILKNEFPPIVFLLSTTINLLKSHNPYEIKSFSSLIFILYPLFKKKICFPKRFGFNSNFFAYTKSSSFIFILTGALTIVVFPYTVSKIIRILLLLFPGK